MHRYYQKSDNKQEAWSMADDGQPGWAVPAKHVSVYGYSEKHHDDLDYDQILFKGDLVIDIDSGDIEEAIAAVNRLLDRLKDMGVDLDLLQVDASGRKGFHVVVPQSAFGPVQPMQWLNHYHRYMVVALSAQVDAPERVFDQNLYKSRALIRVRNKPRDDIPAYKVPLTVDEVRGINRLKYAEMAKAPRHLQVHRLAPDGYKAKGLETLWEKARLVVAKDMEQARKAEPLPLEALRQFKPAHPPKCMAWHRDAINIKQGAANWNKLAMNVAGYLVGAEMADGEREAFVEAFVDAHPNKKESRQERVAEVKAQMRYAGSGKTRFACAFARSALASSPCGNCPVARSDADEGSDGCRIEEHPDGLHYRSGKFLRRMTNFTMAETEALFRPEQGEVHLIGKRYLVKPGGSTPFFSATCFNSVAEFKREVVRHAGLHFLNLTDEALAHLSLHLDRGEAAQISMLDKYGINIPQDGERMPVWIEDGWDIAADGSVGGYRCPEQPREIARLRGREVARPDKARIGRALEGLLAMNRDDVVGIALGWSMACVIKEHMAECGRREFPLLHLAGQQESGKTKTIVRFAALAGADYSASAPPVAPAITKFPMRQLVSSTTTIPRVLDEMNQSRMQTPHWLGLVETVKSVFNRQTLQMGALGRDHASARLGARTIGMIATAPIAYLGWDTVESQDLVSRSISVRLSKHDHKVNNRAQRLRDVERLGWQPLWDFARLAVDTALCLGLPEVEGVYDKHEAALLDSLDARALTNAVTVRMGLWFFRRVLGRHGLDGFLPRVEELEQAVDARWQEEYGDGAGAQKWSQIEDMLAELCMLAHLPKDGPLTGIASGTHYVRFSGQLWLHLPVAWAHYRMHCRSTGKLPVVPNHAQFLEGVRREDYYGADGPLPNAPGTRGWLMIDIARAEARGMDLTGFDDFGGK